MEELPLTGDRLLKIWWSFLWRFVVLTFAGGIAVGIVAAVVALVLRLDPASIGQSAWMQLMVLAMGCGALYLVLRWVFVLKWPEFRIILVRRQD